MTTTTTIAVPTSCAALCTQRAELAQRIDDDLAQTGSGAAIDYGAVEQRIADALGAFERGLHAQILARLDIDVPAIRVWGDEYRRIGRLESDYHTLAGTVRVMRTPAEARSVSISIDRVALPMEEPIEAPPAPVNPPWVGSNEDWRRNAGFCKEVTILEPHPPGAGRGVDPIL